MSVFSHPKSALTTDPWELRKKGSRAYNPVESVHGRWTWTHLEHGPKNECKRNTRIKCGIFPRVQCESRNPGPSSKVHPSSIHRHMIPTAPSVGNGMTRLVHCTARGFRIFHNPTFHGMFP